MEKEYCPNCDKEIKLTELSKNKVFRGIDIDFKYQAFFCPDCNMEIATTKQMGEMQRTMIENWRIKKQEILDEAKAHCISLIKNNVTFEYETIDKFTIKVKVKLDPKIRSQINNYIKHLKILEVT